MISMNSFKIKFLQKDIKDIQKRLANVRWPHEIPGQGWDYGTNLDYMKEFVEYWKNEYDYKKEQDRLNQFDHYMADIDGIKVHFVKIDGKSKNPKPLLMLHGYPWSITTLYRIIPMLTDPERFGGNKEDSFTVIAPSLCGFCLSSPIYERGFNIPRHAEIYNRLMVEGLGYEKYALEGGDWGGIISWCMGRNHAENIRGIHLNYMGIRMRDEVPDDERDPDIIRGLGLEGAPKKPRDSDSLRFWKAAEKYWMYEGAYAHCNMTVPQSLSYAMCDSPVGMAAWFIEKFRSWSDWDESFEELFSKDELITNTLLYYIPKTYSSAIKIYYESHSKKWQVKPGEKVTVPTAMAAFPKDIVPIVKARAEEYFNVVRFNDFPRGGHFAIHEQAEVLSKDIREFFKIVYKGL